MPDPLVKHPSGYRYTSTGPIGQKLENRSLNSAFAVQAAFFGDKLYVWIELAIEVDWNRFGTTNE